MEKRAEYDIPVRMKGFKQQFLRGTMRSQVQNQLLEVVEKHGTMR